MIALMLAATLTWPQQYNTGVTAYRSNDFNSAAATFEQATASPDRALQQRALYNLGNAQYRLGEQFWNRAVTNYQAALALDPNDQDAKFNLDFVKKKIEERKKQQEQQQQQQQQKQNQDQQKKDEQKQDQQQPSPQNQQQQQDDHQQDSRKDAEAQSEQQKQEQKEQQQRAQATQAGNLDKQQAAALLDNLREDEQNWNFFPEVQMKDLKDSGEPAKDW